MAKTYRGTKITGTSASAKVFKKSGVKSAAKNDLYINTSTGHVYQCTLKGNAKTAKWKYIRTDILFVPNTPPGDPAISRNGNRLTASWGYDGNYANAKNGGRATNTNCKWSIGSAYSVGLAGSTFLDLNRDAYYPKKNSKLGTVGFEAWPTNTVGENRGLRKYASYTFKTPPTPTMNGWKFDAETGIVSTVMSMGGGGENERLWTSWRIEVTDTQQDKTWNASSGNETGGSLTVSYNVANYQSLGSDQYVRVRLVAVSKGYAGDSGTLDTSYYVSFPKPVSITGVKVSAKDSSGKMTASVNVSKSTQFPVDRIKLQKLVNVTYETAASIPGDASWTDAGAVDDGNCSALSCDVAGLMPDRGKRTWIRVKAWHAAETLCSYSAYEQVMDLYEVLPTATDNVCTIAKADAIDGESIDVLVAWDLKSTEGDDDTTSMELTWSDDPDAWRSVEKPKSFEFDWRDSTTDSTVSTLWNKSAKVKVSGLAEGVRYYFRARCIVEAEGVETHGEWCNAVSETTTAAPPSVVLSANADTIPTGGGASFSWVLSSAASQAEWELFRPMFELTQDVAVNTSKVYYVQSSGGYVRVNTPVADGLPYYYERADVVLTHGHDQMGSCAIGWERIGANVEDGRLKCGVRCSTGSAWVESDIVSVAVADPPSLSVSMQDVTAQPASFSCELDMPADVSYVLRAQDGSTVASGRIRPDFDVAVWAESIAYAELYERITALEAELSDGPTEVEAEVAVASCESDLDDAIAALALLEPGDEGYDEAFEDVQEATAALTEAQSVVDAYDELESLEDELEAGRDLYSATVTLSSGLKMADGMTYALTATATSDMNLESEQATASMSVGWSHKAPMPSDYVNVDAEDVEDADGRMHRRALVTLSAPAGSAQTDVYDVYRKTHDGLMLLSPEEGLPLDYSFIDERAPFGDAGDYAYRIAVRTADGDSEFADFDYYLEGNCIRFDFGGDYVELPYNIDLTDAYQKDSETVKHMDGSTEAYWNEGVSRKATLSSDVMRIEDSATAAAVRALAQYAGPVFVRTPDGSAYEADVSVKSMDIGYGIVAASFEAVQIAETGAYGLSYDQGGTTTTA